MFFSISLFLFLLFFIQGTKPFKFLTAFFLSNFQLALSAYILRTIGTSNLKRTFFFFSTDVLQWPFLVVTFLTIFLCIGFVYFLQKSKINHEKLSINTQQLLFLSIITLPVFFGILALNSAIWTNDFFGNVGLEEIFYTLSQPLAGTDKGQIFIYILGPLLNTVVLSASFAILVFAGQLFISYRYEMSKLYGKRSKIAYSLISILLLVSGITLGITELGYADLKTYFFEKTQLYENYFTDPNEVTIHFPEQKRNLIYIYLESMETTFLSEQFGGAQNFNLLPNMTELAQNDGINFSNTELLGGALQVPGVGFTVGGMVGQSSGVPLRVTGNFNENEYGNTTNFMPGLTTIGSILENQGYNQTLLIGSDASFGGRDKFYTQHGNYEIRDYNYAIEQGWIPADYKVWWGYEDKKLFEFAKLTTTEKSMSNEPFNLTILTADTHFPSGLMTEETPELFPDQYSNVIHYSDELVYDFLLWVMEQPFYENTTIVLSGDHLSMDIEFFADLDPDYERTVFNLILNTPITPESEKNRQFSTLDMFPTTLAALGATIEGERLGLGVNLFSTKETLIEKLGIDHFSNELNKNSSFYNNFIMKGSDLEVATKLSE